MRCFIFYASFIKSKIFVIILMLYGVSTHFITNLYLRNFYTFTSMHHGTDYKYVSRLGVVKKISIKSFKTRRHTVLVYFYIIKSICRV